MYGKAHFAGPGLTVDGPTTRMTPFDVEGAKTLQARFGSYAAATPLPAANASAAPKRRWREPSARYRPVAPPMAERDHSLGNCGVGSGPSSTVASQRVLVIPAEAGSRVEVTDKATGAANEAASEFRHVLANVGIERSTAIAGRTFLADIVTNAQQSQCRLRRRCSGSIFGAPYQEASVVGSANVGDAPTGGGLHEL